MVGKVRVEGLREFQRALQKADPELRKQVRATFREVGEIVRVDAAARFGRISADSAGGFRVRVRQKGVAVEQSKRRVTGKRGDYGRLQMTTALLPALDSKQGRVVDAFEDAIDKVADIVEG